MSNFSLMGSMVLEPHVAENRYLPLTGGIDFKQKIISRELRPFLKLS